MWNNCSENKPHIKITLQNILTSLGMSAAHARETITISTMGSPGTPNKYNQLRLKRITFYGYGRQDPPVPPSLIDLNLLPNAINITATKAAVQPIALHCKQRNSPQSPVPSKLSSISTPPMMMMSAVEPCDTSSDEGTFYSEVEPRSFILLSSPCPPQPARKQKRKLSIGLFFAKNGDCRSISVKPVGKCCQRKRTSQVPLRFE